MICWTQCALSMEGFTFWLATAPQVFTTLIKPILFLCHHKGFCIVIYLDDILVLVHSKQAGKRACSFLCSLLVRLGLHINFSKSNLCLTQTFGFLGLCWDTVHMSVSSLTDKLADIQQLAHSLLQSPHVTVCRVMSFLGKANFCTSGHSQLWCLCLVIQSDIFSILPTLYINWNSCLICNRAQFLCNFLFLMWLLLLMPHPLIGPFIFRDLVYLYQLVDPGQVLCAGLILPCMSFRLLP